MNQPSVVLEVEDSGFWNYVRMMATKESIEGFKLSDEIIYLSKRLYYRERIPLAYERVFKDSIIIGSQEKQNYRKQLKLEEYVESPDFHSFIEKACGDKVPPSSVLVFVDSTDFPQSTVESKTERGETDYIESIYVLPKHGTLETIESSNRSLIGILSGFGLNLVRVYAPHPINQIIDKHLTSYVERVS